LTPTTQNKLNAGLNHLEKSLCRIYTMNFADDIKKCKPNISAGSLKTYNSLLRSIYKGAFGATDKPDVDNFKKSKPIMEFLNTKPFNVRKTYLAALLCLAPDEKIFKETMMSDIKSYSDNVRKEEMTTKLEESAITQDEIDSITADLKHNADILFKKKVHRLNDLLDIQNYVILSLYNGHIVPRRALDYCAMMYQNFDADKDNYIDFKRNKLVFNQYKTAQKMGKELKGRQELDLPPALKKILLKWIALIPKEVDTLLFNTNLEPLTNVSLNQRLNGIFGGKKSVNALRHFYLTTKYKDLMLETAKMKDEMEDMGSSIDQAKVYVKINDKGN